MTETLLTAAEFRALMADLAHGWTTRQYARAAARFAPDVAYADPVRYRLQGRVELRAFFEKDDGLPQSCAWHTLLFDAATQVGMAEYTYIGTQQYHGVVVLRLADGLITHWREYQHTDEREWTEFAGATVWAAR